MYRKSYEYDAVVINGCVVLCVECAEEDRFGVEKVQPVFLDSEWDYYPVCDKCGKLIEDINFIPKTVDEKDKPHLTIDYESGVAKLSAIDEYGNSFISYERDSFAGEFNTCKLCGILVESGWVCLDGGEVYCDNCIIEEE